MVMNVLAVNNYSICCDSGLEISQSHMTNVMNYLSYMDGLTSEDLDIY